MTHGSGVWLFDHSVHLVCVNRREVLIRLNVCELIAAAAQKLVVL